MLVRKDDIVEIIAGNDKGARGRILYTYPKKNRVVVEAVNIRKKHQRPMQTGRGQTQAGIIQFEAPIHASNVMIVCPQCDAPTRVGIRQGDGVRARVCKKCGEDIDR
ncbi:MAG: 50S ribosomal protein L24 [Anaerolineae bacterium]|nr:50S ribosomal protein L24 [Anaerolineae bacterium]